MPSPLKWDESIVESWLVSLCRRSGLARAFGAREEPGNRVIRWSMSRSSTFCHSEIAGSCLRGSGRLSRWKT